MAFSGCYYGSIQLKTEIARQCLVRVSHINVKKKCLTVSELTLGHRQADINFDQFAQRPPI
jgi:hypothetical protein